MQSPKKVTVVCGIDCLACQDEFFFMANNPLNVKENVELALDFALYITCLAFFDVSVFGLATNTPVLLMLSFMNACLIIAMVSFSLFPRFCVLTPKIC
jgi:hypothetical protein